MGAWLALASLWLGGAFAVTQHSTSGSYSLQSLDFVLQAVAVLLLAIAGLVGRRAASTSQDVRSMLEEILRASNERSPSSVDFDRRSSSTKEITSTQPGGSDLPPL